MSTKTTIAAAILLASVSGAFASEAFDVDINRPTVTQGYDAYAQAPRAQVESRQATLPNANTQQDKAYTGHGSELN